MTPFPAMQQWLNDRQHFIANDSDTQDHHANYMQKDHLTKFKKNVR